MPSFGRLGKHGNRSQQGLAEQQQQKLSSSAVAGADSAQAASSTAPGAASASLLEPAGRGHGAPVTGGVPGQVPGGNTTGGGLNLKTILGVGAGNVSHPVSASGDSPLLHYQPPFPAPSGLSSREEIEAAQQNLRQFQGQGPAATGPNKLQKQPRQAQLQQQQLSHPPPPQHLFNTNAPSQPAQPASSTAPPINTNIPPPAASPANLPPQQHHQHLEAAFVGQQQLQQNALQRSQGNLDDFDVRQVLPIADHDPVDGEALADTTTSPSQRFGPPPLTTASSSTSPSASTPHNLAHLQALPSSAASSPITPGQQGIYGVGVATSSVDELSSPPLAYSSHQPIPPHQQLQPQQQPSQQQGKKSSRKLPIINRFFGSGRTSSQGHHPQPDKQYAQDASFDNAGAGLFSKSASTKRSSRIVPSQAVRQISDIDCANTARSGDVYKPDSRLPVTGAAVIQADNGPPESWHRRSPLREPSTDQADIGDEASSPIRDPYISNNNSQQDLFRRQTESRAALHPADIPNPETSSQLSNESPFTDDSRGDHQASRDTNNQFYDSLQQQPQAMAPAGASTTSRRDAETALRGVKVEPPAGPPPGYRVGAAGANPASLVPGQGAAIGQANSYKGERAAQFEGAPVEQGRDSPQPNAENETESPKFKELLTKYKHVKRLYFDGKNQIEALNGQVETLQNAVANQRMSQSRTALDDSEYVTRFTRLDGAIKDLSFNIRKDWRCLPKWLDSYVSADALKTAKQEMTAVGRAVISRWLVEEIFNKCFHPGLEIPLSMHLKDIELSIRGNAHTMHSREEFDALTTKIVNWRMATLDGLQKKLDVTTTATNRALFVKQATTNLTACLHQYLTTPPPGGIEGSATTIIEIAVGVVANLPLESRDVAIMYPLPGEAVRPSMMDVDKNALPTLDGSQRPESDTEEDDDEERNKVLAKDSKVRFAGFMAVEVRGRQVLMKAPVWIL